MKYRRFHADELRLTDVLALDRTVLANERTLLAYLRTTIMLVISSVSLLKLFPDSRSAVITGLALVPLSIIVAGLGLQRYYRLSRALTDMKRGEEREV